MRCVCLASIGNPLYWGRSLWSRSRLDCIVSPASLSFTLCLYIGRLHSIFLSRPVYKSEDETM